MSIHLFPGMRFAIHSKTIVTILALGLVHCASEETPTEEPITAADIHEIESDSSGTDWASGAEQEPDEDTSLTSEDDSLTTEGENDGPLLTGDQQPDLFGDFASSDDPTVGDWTSAPSDEVKDAEVASFVDEKGSDSDSFLSAMTEPAQIENSFGPVAGGRYIVQPGDSLSQIAAKIYGSMTRWRELADLNEVGKNFVIHPGDMLQFPVDGPNATAFVERFEALPRVTVEVKKGDSLTKIAQRIYGKSNYWKVLMAFNKDVVTSPDRILVGMKLKYVQPTALNTFAVEGVKSGSTLVQRD